MVRSALAVTTALLLLLTACGDDDDDGGEPRVEPAVAEISARPVEGYAPLTVEFDFSGSSGIDGAAPTYRWDFGDGGGSSGPPKQDPEYEELTHTYAEPGTYTAMVTVSPSDYEDTASVQIKVLEPLDLSAWSAAVNTECAQSRQEALQLDQDITDPSVEPSAETLAEMATIGEDEYQRILALGVPSERTEEAGSWVEALGVAGQAMSEIAATGAIDASDPNVAVMNDLSPQLQAEGSALGLTECIQ